MIKCRLADQEKIRNENKEHFRNLRLNHIEKSAIASHFWNPGHEIDNSATLLKSVNKRNKLLIWENIFLYKLVHLITNFEVWPES